MKLKETKIPIYSFLLYKFIDEFLLQLLNI